MVEKLVDHITIDGILKFVQLFALLLQRLHLCVEILRDGLGLILLQLLVKLAQFRIHTLQVGVVQIPLNLKQFSVQVRFRHRTHFFKCCSQALNDLILLGLCGQLFHFSQRSA
ncbi:hypothetical protein Q5W_14575 [Hydrogenophaga sp. PBC]|nr:hypothetical protein Q5W_14575 [Hydrogenophaga sp. PBC]